MVTLEECIALARQCHLDVPDQMLGVVFAESLMTVIDTVGDKERMYQLSYPEFIFFLCRIVDAHYQNTDYETEEFWIKLDNMLVFLLDPFDYSPNFRFGAKFMIDSKETTSYQYPEVIREETMAEAQNNNGGVVSVKKLIVSSNSHQHIEGKMPTTDRGHY